MSNPRFAILLKLAILQGLVLLGGCASDRGLPTLSLVEPSASGTAEGRGPGHLIVRNASHETITGDGVMAYPFDDYKIFNERRSCIKRVRNRGGAGSELPNRVDLPPGRYTVVASSEIQGPVAVPVLIKSGLTTEVDLERPARIITPNSAASD